MDFRQFIISNFRKLKLKRIDFAQLFEPLSLTLFSLKHFKSKLVLNKDFKQAKAIDSIPKKLAHFSLVQLHQFVAHTYGFIKNIKQNIDKKWIQSQKCYFLYCGYFIEINGNLVGSLLTKVINILILKAILSMKKLQHQTSCYAKTDSAVPQTKELTANDKIQLPLGTTSSEVKNLETKLFLLEERTKSITHFYQQKMTQLKLVINKQHQTKKQLTQQLSKLSKQNLRQNSIIAALKNNLADAENLKQSKEIRPSSNLLDGSPQKMSLKRSSNSKGKANPLFSSTRFAQNPEKLLLKKTKSSHNIQSYYYIGQTEAIVNSQKPIKVDLTKFRQ